MVLVPINAPNETPNASTNIALPIFGELPSLSTNPAFSAVPTNVPKVSNNSTKVKVNTTVHSPIFRAPLISNSPTASLLKSGKLNILKCSGITVTPIGMPISVADTIPISKDPFTRIAIRIAVIPNPIKQSTIE